MTQGPSVVVADASSRDRLTQPPKARRQAVAAEPEPIPGLPSGPSPVKWVALGVLGTAAVFAIGIGIWFATSSGPSKTSASASGPLPPAATQTAASPPQPVETAAAPQPTPTPPAVSATSVPASTADKPPQPVKTADKPPEPAKTSVAAATATPPAPKTPATATATKTAPAKTGAAKTPAGGIVRETPF